MKKTPKKKPTMRGRIIESRTDVDIYEVGTVTKGPVRIRLVYSKAGHRIGVETMTDDHHEVLWIEHFFLRGET